MILRYLLVAYAIYSRHIGCMVYLGPAILQLSITLITL